MIRKKWRLSKYGPVMDEEYCEQLKSGDLQVIRGQQVSSGRPPCDFQPFLTSRAFPMSQRSNPQNLLFSLSSSLPTPACLRWWLQPYIIPLNAPSCRSTMSQIASAPQPGPALANLGGLCPHLDQPNLTFAGEMPGEQLPKKKRRKVNHACLYCRRSHMTCDDGRPCQRW